MENEAGIEAVWGWKRKKKTDNLQTAVHIDTLNHPWYFNTLLEKGTRQDCVMVVQWSLVIEGEKKSWNCAEKDNFEIMRNKEERRNFKNF